MGLLSEMGCLMRL